MSALKSSRKLSAFLQEIITLVYMQEVPIELIFNWDQTGLNLVPLSTWTMAAKGSKQVDIRGITVKLLVSFVVH